MKHQISFVKTHYQDILSLFSIFLIGYITLQTTFKYGLYGDDWQHLFNFMKYQSMGEVSPKIFYSAYGGQVAFLQIVRFFFGLQPQYYFYISFFLRALVSIAIYYVIYKTTQTKFLAWAGGTLWIIGLSGIETTTWVLTANTYISTALAVLCVYAISIYYGNDKFTASIKNFLYLLCLLGVTIIITPIRMHGLVLLVPLVETCYFLFHTNKWKNTLLRLLCFVLLIAVFQQNEVFGFIRDTQKSSLQGINAIFSSNESTYKFLTNNIITFSNILIPPEIVNSPHYYARTLRSLTIDWGTVLIIENLTILTFVLIRIKTKTIILTCLSLLFFMIYLMNQFPSQLDTNGIYVITGTGTLFVIGIIIWNLQQRREKHKAVLLLLFTVSTALFYFVPQLYTPQGPISAASRYLTVPYAFAIMTFVYAISCVLFLVRRKNNIQSLIIVLMCYISLISIGRMQYFSVTRHLERGLITRAATVSNKMYFEINKAYQPLIGSKGIVAYFDYDDLILYIDAVQFGGTYRLAVENNILNAEELPSYITDKNQLIKLINTTEEKESASDKIDKVIAFKVRDRNIENISDNIKSELRRELIE